MRSGIEYLLYSDNTTSNPAQVYNLSGKLFGTIEKEQNQVDGTWLLFIQRKTVGAVIVVKWSACSPSTPEIRAQIPLKITVFCKICVWKERK